MGVVLITGCGSGFGASLATRLANEGHDVIATVRCLDQQFHTAESESVHYVQMDVTNKTEISCVIEQLHQQKMMLDVVVLNAGSYPFGTIESISDVEARASFEVNYWGCINVLRSVLPMMRQRQKGKIIGIGSISSAVGLPVDGYYSASKAALERMLESLRYEVMPFGIDVSIISPASFKSNLLNSNSGKISETDPYYPLLKNCLKNMQDTKPLISIKEIEDITLEIINETNPDFVYPVGKMAIQVLEQLKVMSDDERHKAILDWSGNAIWCSRSNSE